MSSIPRANRTFATAAQLLNKLSVDEVELILPVPSPMVNSEIAPAKYF